MAAADQVENTQLEQALQSTQPEDALTATCNRCRKVFPRGALATKSARHKQLLCGDCLRLERYLNRLELPALEEDDRRALFEKSSEITSSLSLERVRAELSHLWTVRLTKEVSHSHGGEFKPLSMHAASGLGEEQLKNLEENGDREWCAALGCWTFKLELRTDKRKEVQSKVGERVAQVTLKPKKRKALASGPEAAAVEDCDLEVSDEEGGDDQKLTKAQKVARKAEAKASLELTKLREKERKAAFALATRVIPRLRADSGLVKGALGKVTKDEQPLLEASLTQQAAKLEGYLQECCDVVVGKAASLTFNKEEVEKELQCAQSLCRTLQAATAKPTAKPKTRVRGKKAADDAEKDTAGKDDEKET